MNDQNLKNSISIKFRKFTIFFIKFAPAKNLGRIGSAVLSGRNNCMKDEYFRMKNSIMYLNILEIVCYIRDRFRYTTSELEH